MFALCFFLVVFRCQTRERNHLWLRASHAEINPPREGGKLKSGGKYPSAIAQHTHNRRECLFN